MASPSSSRNCPETKTLSDWANGRGNLSEDDLGHIDVCESCQLLLNDLTDDPHLFAWSHQHDAGQIGDQFLEEPNLQQVKQRLQAIDQDSTVESSTEEPQQPDTHPVQAALDDTAPESQSSDYDSLDCSQIQSGLPEGRFTVDRLLASGGSGEVYLGYDHVLLRQVAIKVLSRHSMRDRKRFIREAQLLAELQHPNIVRIFDFGELKEAHAPAQPRLFLTMEYLTGGSTSQLAIVAGNSNGSQPAAPEASFKQVAALIAEAANGLQAAHEKGLIHRDVKPANLLFDADLKNCKVADFGLARLADVDSTKITRTGEMVGTPAFMSPEQVSTELTVTPASDVYSLGATLYSLLTGQAPFLGTPGAVLRQVADGQPAPPRLLNPEIPIDLATICTHAMDKESKSRYASMSEFAADLQRFSNGQPIHARPLNAVDRIIRYARRNPTLAAVVLACAMLAVILLVGSVATAVVLQNKNQELATAIDGERQARLDAQVALQESIEAADALLLAVTTDTELLPRTPGSQKVTQQLLAKARDYFREFLDANEGNPELTYHLARAHAGLATVAMREGDASALEKETETALELIDDIPADAISAEERASMISDTLVVFGNYLTEAGEATRSLPVIQRALEACEAAGASESQSEELRASYAASVLALAEAQSWVGNPEATSEGLLQARNLYESLSTAKPKNADYIRNLAVCDMTLASTAIDRNEPQEGKGFLLSALSLLEQIGEEDAISLRIREMRVKIFTNLALAERRMGNNLEAKGIYQKSINETQRLIELEPGLPSHQWNLVVAVLNSGGPDLELGNLQELVDRWRTIVPVLEDLRVAEPENQRYEQVQAMLQSNIAIVLRDMGEHEQAIEPLLAATEILQKQAEQLEFAAESYLPVALNHYELATTFIKLHRWSEAATQLDTSTGIVDEILEAQPDFTPAKGHRLDVLFAGVDLLLQQRTDLPSAAELAQQCIEQAKNLQRDNPDVEEYSWKLPQALVAAGKIQLELRQPDTALQYAEQAKSVLESQLASKQGDSESERPKELEVEIKALMDRAQSELKVDENR